MRIVDNNIRTPPTFLGPNFEGMPIELTQRPNWVLWVPIWNRKWTKRPIQPSGFGASTTNPKHWSSFEEVKQAFERAQKLGFIELRERGKPTQCVPIGGVGYVFDGQPDEDGLVFAGIDFDKVISGDEIAFDALERIRHLSSYTERSVSGSGLHVIARARPLRSGIAHQGIEIYTSGRFFTMTGCTLENTKIAAAPEAVAQLAVELQPQVIDGSTAENPLQKYDLSKFTAHDRDRLQKIFGHLSIESLADGLEANIDEIRSAVAAIPSLAIASEPEWMRLARALAYEAAHFNRKEELWEILDTASRRAPGYDQEDNRQRFERYMREASNHASPITIDTLFFMALEQGWSGSAHLASAGRLAPLNGRAIPITCIPLMPRKREWLHGNDLIRGAVSMLVAPGARAKTTWLLACALACASGRALLGAHVYGGRLRVLYLSAEDSTDEIALRLRAAMQHYNINDNDASGLHVIAADKWGLPLLHTVGTTPVIDQRGWDALITELDRIKPDVLIIDPLINIMGGVSSNDNSAAALLMGKLVTLAATQRIAVMLAHHAAKGRDPTSAESAMGAASFVNLSRIALGIEPLAKDDAARVGLPPWEAKSIFRIVGTKQNFNAPDASDRWFRVVSVEMQNQRPPVYPAGDHVAVIEPFQPGTSGPMFPEQLIRDALAAVANATPPLSPSKRSSERYAAPVVAQAIAPHRAGQVSETEGQAVLDHLLRSGLIKVQPVKLARAGSRSDVRNGLVLTAMGQAIIQPPNHTLHSAPQVPQPPATTLQGDAGGDPLGSPATQGGCGGNAGSNSKAAD